MLLRIQSSEGTKRVEVKPSDSILQLYRKASQAFGVSIEAVTLYNDKLRKKELLTAGKKTVNSSKLVHGDMIYMHSKQDCASNQATPMDIADTTGGCSSSNSSYMNSEPSTSNAGSSSKGRNSSLQSKVKVVEDSLDQQLKQEEGRIPGKRNPVLCHHKGNSRCIHCTDIDPWDENYLKTNNIKHMSFHTYLKKLKSGVDKGKFVQVSSIQCSIKSGCTEHPPWPQGICSSCQPSAVTLSSQPFRHVDAVIFENRTIVENFLTYWRTTGHQRAGILYGRHVVHRDVPLGIRAEVAAIYEPPQESTTDYLKLLPDNNKPLVDQVAAGLGLVCVGWVFTDLVPLDASSGTVRHLRHSDTYFLSSHEVMTAASLQLQHPNTCSLSPNGVYGSRFATVIVTGDANNQVHMEGYQVSHQCEALVSANCLLPTLDAPELAYVKESTTKQYVPDVFFKEKDEYGNEVTRLGRPLPVEYLLLDLPVSTPNNPTHTFTERTQDAFPIENRLLESHLQDFATLAIHIHRIQNDSEFLKFVSDFHVLLYLYTMDVVPLRAEMAALFEAITSKDLGAIGKWRNRETWSTVEKLVEASPPPGQSSGAAAAGGGSAASRSSNSNGVAGTGAAGAAAGESWTCVHCTFINQSTGGDVCDMCHLPR